MEQVDQSDYFRRRAEEERDAAHRAGDERAAQSHRALAARYDARARGSPVHDVTEDGTGSGGTLSDDFTILP